MVGYGQFGKLLDKATSHLLMEHDLATTLNICDLIRQGDVPPKVAFTAIKKKLSSANPHAISHTLMVLESIVKNCPTVHEELASREFLDALHDLAKSTTHTNVRNKVLELLQAWSHVFKNNAKFEAIQDTVNQMKAEGFKFPALRESEAMFSATNAPTWVDGETCHRCRVQFNFITRKHHCRACGQVFCGECSKKTITLPKFGIEKEVRVCDSCYAEGSKTTSTAKAPSKTEELPYEYLKSGLYQQKQQTQKKTEEELREEEDLQMALALSQSEAETKEKERERAAKLKTNVNVSPPTVFKQPEVRPVEPQEEETDPELAKYLNRAYWESRTVDNSARVTSPSAPLISQEIKLGEKENGMADNGLEDFMNTLRSQVEIFINRMKSNSSRGRSIANDTSVQTLFMNITAMHSKLLGYIKEHDDSRLHFECLQDKLTQIKDARAALDALREEHREKMRREAEEAERLRQLQMAHKLEIMRKKKQEYLQYQRQLVLQRVQEQEREMQMRQEQQKQYIGQQPYQLGGYMQQYQPAYHYNQHMMPPGMSQMHPLPQMPPGVPQMPPGVPQMPQGHLPPPQMAMGQPLPQHGMVPLGPQQGGMPGQPPPQQVGMAMPFHPNQMGPPPNTAMMNPRSGIGPQQQYHPQAGPPPTSPQQEETQTAELISFD